VILNHTRIYIDNTPFPTGLITNYDPLTVFIMKENIYSTSSDMYTATYALILVFAMLCVVVLGISVKLHRVRMQFRDDKKGFAQSFIKPNTLLPDNGVVPTTEPQ
jgi:hypothetical protein